MQGSARQSCGTLHTYASLEEGTPVTWSALHHADFAKAAREHAEPLADGGVFAKRAGVLSDAEEALAALRDARVLGSLPSSALEVLWYTGAQYMPALGPLGGGASGRMTEALDDQLIGQLVDRAKAGGLTGERGLLPHLTKRLLAQGR